MPHPCITETINLFNQELFYEAHDCLEEFWRDYQGKDKHHYQALIQLIVTLHLQQESKFIGAEKVLARALLNMQDYPAGLLLSGIDLNKLRDEVIAYCSGAQQVIPKLQHL